MSRGKRVENEGDHKRSRIPVAAHGAAAEVDRGLAAELETARESLRAAGERIRHLARRLDDSTRAHQVFIEVSRDMLAARSEEEVVSLMGEALRRLLPGRRFALRVVDASSFEVTHQVWSGPTPPRSAGTLRFKRSAFRRMGLPDEVARHPRVILGDEYQPVFEDGAEGLAMPLVATGALHGLLNIEYAPGEPNRRQEDGLLVRPLVNQVSMILRKLSLLAEGLVLKEYLEKIVDNANVVIVMLDREQRVRVINREFLRLTGLPRVDVVGRPFTELLPVEERHRFLRVVINSLRGEPTPRFETHLRARGGKESRVELNAAPILTRMGDVESVVVVGRDLTQVRALERQVIHAEKLATLGQLAAGVVHELNTPLTSISVWADYLVKKLTAQGLPEADLEKLRRIQDGAERIGSFTRDLTVYARPAASELVALNVNDVLRQSISFCEHVLSSRKAIVRASLDPELPRVFGIAGQLQQVFINLLTNASDATAETGGGHVDVSTSVVGERVHIDVRDEGPGIAPDVREQVFEPFFTTKPPGRGTGLGLSIVRDIVESHGGEICVMDVAERGAWLRVSLPTARRSEPPR